MVLNKYTTKETNYINALKIDESKKREKNKIDKINKQINNCKNIIDSKKNRKDRK